LCHIFSINGVGIQESVSRVVKICGDFSEVLFLGATWCCSATILVLLRAAVWALPMVFSYLFFGFDSLSS